MKIAPVDPFWLAEQLGVDITNTDGRKDGQPSAAGGGSASPEAESVDLDDHPQVGEQLAEDTGDRSVDSHRVVAACIDDGLTLPQTRWVISQRPDLAERVAEFFARSTPVDDVQNSWDKLRKERFQEVQSLGQAAGNSQAAAGNGQAAGVGRRRKRKAKAGKGSRANTSPGAPDLDDAHIGPHIAERCLVGEYLFSGAFGWMRYDGRRWERTDDSAVLETIRRGVIDLHGAEAGAGASTDRLKGISGLFSSHRMAAIQRVARGYLRHAGEEFDAHLDLLNVRNGVVDLRDGTLRPHDPALLFTRVAPTDYVPGKTHPDWHKALTAVSADEAQFLQDRLGQGLTGYPPDDDRLLVLKGGGENGKSTIFDGVRGAVGAEYAIPLPDRVLTARPGDHPTELMELRGARLALAEEFPELAHLNVKRLKDLLGTEWLSARYCGKDTVRWKATHTPIVTTNYSPRVDESDHGTWRRLMMLAFPHRYRKAGEPMETPFDRLGDEGLRGRVRRGEDGQHEAALAWLVAGAVRWHQSGRALPKPPGSVTATTAAWRRTADLILRFLNDQLIPDKGSHVMSKELYEDFVEWLKGNGHAVWADQSFTARLEQHSSAIAKDVQKKIVRQSSRLTLSRRQRYGGFAVPQPAPQQYTAWVGVRFRTANDAPQNGHDQWLW